MQSVQSSLTLPLNVNRSRCFLFPPPPAHTTIQTSSLPSPRMRGACRILPPILPSTKEEEEAAEGSGASVRSHGFTPVFPGETEAEIRLREAAYSQTWEHLDRVLQRSFLDGNAELCRSLTEYIQLPSSSGSLGTDGFPRASRLRVVLLDNCMDLPLSLELGLGTEVATPSSDASMVSPGLGGSEVCLVHLETSGLTSVRRTLQEIQYRFRQKHPTTDRETRFPEVSPEYFPAEDSMSAGEAFQSLLRWFQRYSTGHRRTVVPTPRPPPSTPEPAPGGGRRALRSSRRLHSHSSSSSSRSDADSADEEDDDGSEEEEDEGAGEETANDGERSRQGPPPLHRSPRPPQLLIQIPQAEKLLQRPQVLIDTLLQFSVRQDAEWMQSRRMEGGREDSARELRLAPVFLLTTSSGETLSSALQSSEVLSRRINLLRLRLRDPDVWLSLLLIRLLHFHLTPGNDCPQLVFPGHLLKRLLQGFHVDHRSVNVLRDSLRLCVLQHFYRSGMSWLTTPQLPPLSSLLESEAGLKYCSSLPSVVREGVTAVSQEQVLEWRQKFFLRGMLGFQDFLDRFLLPTLSGVSPEIVSGLSFQDKLKLYLELWGVRRPLVECSELVSFSVRLNHAPLSRLIRLAEEVWLPYANSLLPPQPPETSAPGQQSRKRRRAQEGKDTDFPSAAEVEEVVVDRIEELLAALETARRLDEDPLGLPAGDSESAEDEGSERQAGAGRPSTLEALSTPQTGRRTQHGTPSARLRRQQVLRLAQKSQTLQQEGRRGLLTWFWNWSASRLKPFPEYPLAELFLVQDPSALPTAAAAAGSSRSPAEEGKAAGMYLDKVLFPCPRTAVQLSLEAGVVGTRKRIWSELLIPPDPGNGEEAENDDDDGPAAKKKRLSRSSNQGQDPTAEEEDVTLLFRLLQEVGRQTLNVYDWFQSFSASLETTDAPSHQKRDRSRKKRKTPKPTPEELRARFFRAALTLKEIGLISPAVGKPHLVQKIQLHYHLLL